MGYLGDPDPDANVRAIPGEGTNVPIWILGSSHGGAQVAAALGLPYSFASHFAPAALMSALEVYRRGFQPSPLPGGLDAPRTMAGANVMVADSQAEAERQFTSVLERFRSIVTNRRSGLLPPSDATPDELLASWSPAERAAVAEMTKVSFVGTPAQVRDDLEVFTKATGVDEVIVTCGAFDPEVRQRSLELLADVWS
jgi:luciferase family oxidoreductase group 1